MLGKMTDIESVAPSVRSMDISLAVARAEAMVKMKAIVMVEALEVTTDSKLVRTRDQVMGPM
jgi:hypothetical protein